MIIIDDVSSGPLSAEEREKLMKWYHEDIVLNPNLEVHFTVLPNGDTITSIRPKT